MKYPLAGIFAAVALAQASPLAAQSEDLNDLGQAVLAAQNDTPLQVSAGNSLQNTCADLASERPNGIPMNDNPEDNLALRCTQMVVTAVGLNDPGGSRGGFDLGLNNEQLAEAMQQLSGEEQVSKGRLATESSNGQFGNIGMRLDAIRAGARATAGGLSVAMNGMPVSGGNAGDEDSGWGWFLNGAVGTGDRDATAGEDEYEYDSFGATLGFDYMYDSGFVAGIALGYSDYEVDFETTQSFVAGTDLTSTQSGGGFEVDGYSISLYGIGDVGPISVDGLVSYGQSEYDTERIIDYRSAPGANTAIIVNRSMTGSTDSESLTIGLNASKVLDLGGVDLALSGGFSYLDLTVDGYTEKDRAIGMDTAAASGLALRYEDQDVESLQSAVGAQVSKVFWTGTGVILPFAKGEWRLEFENDSDAIKTRYAAYDNEVRADGSDLIVNSDDPDEDYFEVGIGVSAVFAQNIQAFIDYTTTVDLDDVSADLITIGIRGSF
ncbi:MAG: autotransporter outer membrane beta-barrel domain-containing protein [Halioglobus sp.]|nr:autotransporter outer membrane beta-barrel domain-containing protein [Halioglobus sp.]